MVVLAATNRLDMIDPAILRAGRFDVVVELPLPDEEAREKILKIHTRGKPLAKNINIKQLAKTTEGLAGADLEAITRQASALAIREFLSKKRTDMKKDLDRFQIKMLHFEKAIKILGFKHD